jgi:hypothetical protein
MYLQMAGASGASSTARLARPPGLTGDWMPGVSPILQAACRSPRGGSAATSIPKCREVLPTCPQARRLRRSMRRPSAPLGFLYVCVCFRVSRANLPLSLCLPLTAPPPCTAASQTQTVCGSKCSAGNFHCENTLRCARKSTRLPPVLKHHRTKTAKYLKTRGHCAGDAR